MSVHAGSRSITDRLILNIDAKNQYCFGGVNYIANSAYSATDWSNIYPANTTIVTGIDDPLGTNTAIRVICANTGSSLIRVLFPAFTPNGTDTYTSSFYARLITPTFGPGLLVTDVHDQNPTRNYASSLVANTWIRVETSGIPSSASKSFIDLISDGTTNAAIDFWGVQLEPAANATMLTETNGSVKTSRANTVHDLSVLRYSPTFTFTGTSKFTSNPEKFETGATTEFQQSYLTPTNPIIFNDQSEYSMEFWVKLRANAEVNYHSLAGQNTTNQWLTLYTYNTLGNNWIIRYRNSAGNYIDSTAITTSNIQSSWNNINVTVDSSRNINFYLNGQSLNIQSSSSTLFTINAIMGGYNSSGTFHPLQGSLAVSRIYSKKLSGEEVRINFNSLRSRFGI